MTTELLIKGHVPMMNKLLRLHWKYRSTIQANYQYELRSQNPRPHPGKVKIEIWRHSTGRGPDQDGLVSSAKTILDALVKNKTIIDDNPSILVKLECQHVNISRKIPPFTIIRIIDIDP